MKNDWPRLYASSTPEDFCSFFQRLFFPTYFFHNPFWAPIFGCAYLNQSLRGPKMSSGPVSGKRPMTTGETCIFQSVTPLINQSIERITVQSRCCRQVTFPHNRAVVAVVVVVVTEVGTTNRTEKRPKRRCSTWAGTWIR